MRDQIARSGRARSNVLITGESGTGKELAARELHAASSRRDQPFVPVNCGAIPEALLESQLFGHLRGAFTTAVQANPGLFATANRGTLFLDEIGELPLALQVKLLRVIEERQVWPVGGTRAVPVDVRLIASTNRDLAQEVGAGRFREDLYYRLNVVRLEMPPLRERRVRHPDAGRSPDAPAQRQARHARAGRRARGPAGPHGAIAWRGNVRELENVLERAMVMGDGDLITLKHLPADVATADAAAHHTDLREAVRQFERQHLRNVLAETNLDKREAAQLLGISLASLYRKLNTADN